MIFYKRVSAASYMMCLNNVLLWLAIIVLGFVVTPALIEHTDNASQHLKSQKEYLDMLQKARDLEAKSEADLIIKQQKNLKLADSIHEKLKGMK
jgi:hypothetical protein